jgi:hypothetical protein
LEVFIAGTLVGALGGILLFTVREGHRGSEMACGITVGAVMFVISFLFAWLSGNIAPGVSWMQLLTMGVAPLCFWYMGSALWHFSKGSSVAREREINLTYDQRSFRHE